MIDLTLNNLFDSHDLCIPAEVLLSLISDEETFVFIKNDLSVYRHANQRFIELMGGKKLKDVYGHTDHTLCGIKDKVKIYLQHDAEVFDTGKPLLIKEEVAPIKNGFVKKYMGGTLYPIYGKSSTPVAVLGIVKPHYQRFKLTLEEALCLSAAEFDKLLLKRSYTLIVYNQTISLSKREIQCILELLKGNHAGEIARTFSLKQSTIEFYLENIKNKLGATGKASLISTVFNEKIIQQIIL